jgi:hypothetical protein
MLSNIVNTTNTINEDANAVISAINYCENGESDYIVTLPAVSESTGKCLMIKIASDCTNLVTVRGVNYGPPRPPLLYETIDGNVDGRIMWAKESAILYCDGTEWKKVTGYSRPMTAIKSLHSSQTFNKLTETTIALDIPMTSECPDAMVGTASTIIIQRPSNYKISYCLMYASNSGGGGEEARIAIDGVVFTKSVSDAAANNKTIVGSFATGLTSEAITMLGYYDGSSNLSPAILGRHSFGDTVHVTYLAVEEIIGW